MLKEINKKCTTQKNNKNEHFLQQAFAGSKSILSVKKDMKTYTLDTKPKISI